MPRFRRLLSIGLGASAAAAAVLASGALRGEATSPLPAPGTRGCSGCRLPPANGTWHYQLQGRLRLSGARVYDIDGLDAPAAFVSRLRSRHRYSICYVDAGTWEHWRPDRRRFPDSVLGRGNGWPGERWLDIRRMDVLAPIIEARIRACRRKGFDAVEPDNVDAYANRTGFPLTFRDQLAYNRRLAGIAHRLGLAVGLKNDLEQVGALRRWFDFAVVEQCFELDECHKLRPFVRSGKPIFDVEYNVPRSGFCSRANDLGINALSARPSLAGPGTPCGS
jgi:hypothetical protein